MRKLIKMFAAGWSAGNKKRIVISLSTIGIVAAMAVGVTVSYFQDKETSTGNKFQAGKLNLKIDNTCHYNGMICTASKWVEESAGSAAEADLIGTPCTCSWSAKDLTNEMFFNFLDVKPGDIGEDTVSLHVDNNDAWVCAEITNLKNFENGCDSPENKIDTVAGSCGTGLTDPGEGLGELQNNLFFSIWKDNGANANACNNVKDADETYLVENQPATSNSWPIADSTTGGVPIKGNETTCLGIAWNVPITASNIIQTDSFTGDVIFNAVQARNMKNFKCSDLYAEVCDGVDNDYDNIPDNGPLWTNKGQACSVGVGACATAGTYICNANAPAGATVCSATPGTPGMEVCDGIDNNCDGQNNEGLLKDWYQDNDQDGFGNLLQKLNACAQQQGFVEDGTDCDDTSSAIKPGATEVCNGIDDNCDGRVDENSVCAVCGNGIVEGTEQCDDGNQNIYDFCNTSCTKIPDLDFDGYAGNDCNDNNATINPGATEVCNGQDDDCDGVADEGNPGGGMICSTGLLGVCSAGTTQCNAGQLMCIQNQQPVAEGTSLPKSCDGIDNDCDGTTDEFCQS